MKKIVVNMKKMKKNENNVVKNTKIQKAKKNIENAFKV